jgi:hypothetical protein
MLVAIILATQKTEIRRIADSSQPVQIVCKTPSPKKKKKKKNHKKGLVE